MAYNLPHSPLKEIIQLNLLPFFKKHPTITRQLKVLQAIQKQKATAESTPFNTSTKVTETLRSVRTYRGTSSLKTQCPNLIVRSLSDFLDVDKLIDYNYGLLKDL